MALKVYVGMSGGVDSSLSAALLKAQGHQVTGVYMKNWTQDLPGMKCPWAEDLADAKRVAVQLGIPFKVFDFQTEYKQKVVDYMIAQYQAGRTPNPDIMCNQEVKFKLFLDTALADGADMIATGHYAKVVRDGEAAGDPEGGVPRWRTAGTPASTSGEGDLRGRTRGVALFTAADSTKDQTYFLYRVTQQALSKTLFPLGDLTKTEVRAQAIKLGLATATKKDSQGICFVGKVGIKDFLQQYITTQPGNIVDKQTGKIIGQHEGAIFYTLGQRHGMGLGGGLPYYVVDKNMSKNIIYVTTNLNDQNLWHKQLELTQLHWINQPATTNHEYQIRTRYRAPLIKGHVTALSHNNLKLNLNEPERAITPGQSAVIYDHDRVVGGGIVVSSR